MNYKENYDMLTCSTTLFGFFFLVDYNQVIYTVGRDPQYQKTVVADTGPLVTAPVVVSNVLL